MTIKQWISDSELAEISSIIEKGKYIKNRRMKIHIEYLVLAFLKYLFYANISSWRSGCPNRFSDCPITKGKRSQAIFYLKKAGIVWSNHSRKRWFCVPKKEIERFILNLEKEIKKKEEMVF